VVLKILSEEGAEEGEEVVGLHAFENSVYSKLVAKRITNILLATRLTPR
jgi:hypothetical protein